MSSTAKPNVFDYEDYRTYLRDYYDYRKQVRSTFSFRMFSREAGFSSPNFLQLVMKGKRNLSAASIEKCAKALKLNGQETDFFEKLVLFNQAERAEEKNRYFRLMTKNRKYRAIRKLVRDQFEYYSHWYYSAVREIVTLKDFREDPKWIAEKLSPGISEKEACEALELLVKLNLLTRNQSGKLVQSNPTISSGAEVRSLAIRNHHREMLQRAARAMDGVKASQRDISSVTLGVPAAHLEELKSKIRKFRTDLLASIGSLDAETDEVYQLNVQLFPLTKKDTKK